MFNISEILAKAQLLINTIQLLNSTVSQLHVATLANTDALKAAAPAAADENKAA